MTTVTSKDVNFDQFFGKIGSLPKEKGQVVQTCLTALKNYQADSDGNAKTGNSMEVLGLLIAQGAKGSKTQQQQAKKIAEALIGTKLFENASHSVRNNIEEALKGTTWIGAKFREALLVAFNWHKYGVDSTHKQAALLDGAIKSLSSEKSRAESLDLPPLDDAVRAHNKAHPKDLIDQRTIEEFTAVVLEEWEKLPQEQVQPPQGGPEAPPAPEEEPAMPPTRLLLLEAPKPKESEEETPLEITDHPPTEAEAKAAIAEEKEAAAIAIVAESNASDKRRKARLLFESIKKGGQLTDPKMSGLSTEEVKFLVRYAINTLKFPDQRSEGASRAILTWYKENVIDCLRSKGDRKYAQAELSTLLTQTSCGRSKADKTFKASLYKIIGAKVPEALEKYA